MHGRGGGEERKTTRHTWMLPLRATAVLSGDGGGSPSSSSFSTDYFFCKDGRRISVGDCALFKPPKDSPPFIGIIRCLPTGKENKIKLGVNWLYRPSEVKLGKGILLDAAPNEIFYSFHKDEIPAASLLHPCKVAFLPKGIELPSGICSFVCRRVYDITNKCLWWLTDQDYINERQEEVDQLLYKTRLEMHASAHTGGRSPKPVNGPTLTSQLKPGPDSIQNTASSFPSQSKGKKRERGEQVCEPVKRERTNKMDDVDSGHSRNEINLKSDIAKIAENGGLEDSEGVERLVQLMLPDRNEKKIDLMSRSMLAGVVAATDKFDCLSRFVQLKGLPVFDEWLQEVHKGKIGDCGSSKDSDKSVEEFLLILLRALDKLPVNLNALQMCNIGKSVNHLRTHKNLEIQKKARSLVDTWKKRVEAEMDAKSGLNPAVSWSPRVRLSEVSPSGGKHSVSTDVANKSSITQLSAPKTGPIKLAQGESATKSAASPGSTKVTSLPGSAVTNVKDGQCRNATLVGGGSADPQTTAWDDKSSSSSQSHNNSQSCSSDHAKTGGFSGKEDAKSSAAGSGAVNKISGGSLRHRKLTNGFPGPSVSGIQREAGSVKNSSHRNLALEKFSSSALTCEKADLPISDSSHKLVVKIPNPGRSPAQSGSGGSHEDQPIMNSRASSPVLLEKHDQVDRNFKERNDAYKANAISDVNTESWQSNDFKDVLAASDEGDGSPAPVANEENGRTEPDAGRMSEVLKTASSSSANELKSGKLHDASFCSINALIDSVKYSEANVCVPVGDDAGMNLLASVAAGEISKSDVGTPIDSPQRNASANELSSTVDDLRVKSSSAGEFVEDQQQPVEVANDEHQKQGVMLGSSWSRNVDTKIDPALEKSGEEKNGNINSSSVIVPISANHCPENVSKEIMAGALANTSLENIAEKASNSRDNRDLKEKETAGDLEDNSCQDSGQEGSTYLLNQEKLNDTVKVEAEIIKGSTVLSSETDIEDKKSNSDCFDRSLWMQPKLPSILVCSSNGNDKETSPSSCGNDKDMVIENVNEMKMEEDNHIEPKKHAVRGLKGEQMEENSEGCEVHEPCRGSSTSKTSTIPVPEKEQLLMSKESKLTDAEADEAEECSSTTADAPSSASADLDAKMEFDLNEGFNADDAKYAEPNNLSGPGSSGPVQLISPLPFSISALSSSLPASITIASAAKKPFVPPDDLLRTKGALGWKGSAATSAFRPAEPRKALDMPLGTNSMSLPNITASKHSRPPLDIDLNVPDERVLEDLASRCSAQDTNSAPDLSNNRDVTCGQIGSLPAHSSGGLDLDLNRVDEPTDLGIYAAGHGRRPDVSLQSVKSSPGIIHNGEASVHRDFDLNNGPVVDEVSAEPPLLSQHCRSSNASSQTPFSSLRMSSSEVANFSSWFSTGNSTYSAVTIPSILPDKGEQPFPIVATGGLQRVLPPTASAPFSPDMYRGPVLSSSPAIPFPSAPFQYPVFPFGTTSFPLPSTSFSGGTTTYADSTSNGRLCFPAVHSQLIGPAGTVASHYTRPPFVVSVLDGNNNSGADSSRKWRRHGLDLNAGPGAADMEGRDETSPLASKRLAVVSSQALADEHARMCPVGGGVLKRKEPDGGWDGYKQSSWQ